MQNDFPIAKDAYVAFDGLSIKEKIKARLLQSGLFTDQNYEGSNLSALNDVVAMLGSFLIFNTNKSSANGQFNISKLYEVMNGIVKQLDYKPIGHQTASVTFNLTSQTHPIGSYTIPRYSHIKVGGLGYSLTEDFPFTKGESENIEVLSELDDGGLLFQGQFVEYPTQLSSGNSHEIVTINVDANTIIDNFHIHVFVKEATSTGKWEQWQKVTSAYLYNSSSKVFEVRFNEKRKYEIKFGNNINGKKLNEGDQIAIYYLKSNGSSGEIGANVISSQKMIGFSTVRYNQILNDIQDNSNYTTYLDRLTFNNPLPSTYYNVPESVEQIRENAPSNFRSQFSLTTHKSYETFIRTNFSNIIHDIKILNNDEYLDSYSKYFFGLGLTKPQLENRALFNQVRYADSCNFNNIYCFTVPKTIPNTLSYMVPEQKSLILSTIKEEKTLTAEIIIADPVYMAFDFAVSDNGSFTLDDIEYTNIVIEKESNSRRDDISIKTEVGDTIRQFFNRKNNKLGQTININQLNADILAIDGVKNVKSQRTDSGVTLEGLQMLLWNPFYTDYLTSVNSNFTLEVFQFPYLNTTNLDSRIVIV
jgi:hypothetical protein